VDAKTAGVTPEPEQHPTSASETTRGPGILANREAQDGRAAEERRKKIEEAAEALRSEVENAVGDLKKKPIFTEDAPAERAASNKFYRNFEILQLAASHAAAPGSATALATEYKEWMDKQ